jgi:hypothetical protein
LVAVVTVRREKALDFSGCNSRPGTGSFHLVAIEAAAEATKRSELSMERVARRLGERAGHNVSKRGAGPEKVIAGADLTVTQGRPLTMERDERTSSIGPAGVMAMACTHRRPDATREAPAVIIIRINWQLARDRPGRVGWRRGS